MYELEKRYRPYASHPWEVPWWYILAGVHSVSKKFIKKKKDFYEHINNNNNSVWFALMFDMFWNT